MKFVNQDTNNHPDLRVSLNSALPISPKTLVARFDHWTPLKPGPGAESSVTVPPGTYYVYAAAGSPDKIPAGTTVVQVGGVAEGATVTLTPDDRVIIQ